MSIELVILMEKKNIHIAPFVGVKSKEYENTDLMG